jgi:predicted enzyme related to lactoylglutathione lyase
MSRVIHFDLSADEPESAAEFYKKVFGGKLISHVGTHRVSFNAKQGTQCVPYIWVPN